MKFLRYGASGQKKSGRLDEDGSTWTMGFGVARIITYLFLSQHTEKVFYV